MYHRRPITMYLYNIDVQQFPAQQPCNSCIISLLCLAVCSNVLERLS